MKKIFKYIALLTFLVFLSVGLAAQPQPGQNGDGSGVGGDPIGGGASIGGGVAILLSLAAGYGLKKVYDARRKLDE
ncbi:MAG: hypothetical protein KKA81_05855 [Bacteroidetes bacterium]|nr:hypothetical protein [Bacteroidota bacterium]